MKWIDRLKKGLKKTQDKIVGQVSALTGRGKIDDEVLEDLEAILISSDMGVETTMSVIDALRERSRIEGDAESDQLMDWLRDELHNTLEPVEEPLRLRTDGQPTVMLILGVNGSGKTTSIAKMAQYLKEIGKEKITLGAGDTFRAAAIEQLEVWADRVGAKIIKHQSGSDPASVAFDSTDYAINQNQDVLLIDTAGRLQTKHNLMEELKKISRVVEKRLERSIDETLLVIDSTSGQNALSQAKLFHEAVPLTGLVVTKLDGTPKGGMVISIAKELGIPVKFIGVGESAEDLREFKREEFIEALFS